MSVSGSAPSGERNLVIQASAGSGKTHHLVGRFLRLLLAFREPDRIIALTFTRKAAGEFFDRILGALADAASSGSRAERAAKDFRVDGLTRETALELLRLSADSLHRLSLGTLDSFYSRVLRTFPGEFGIGGNFEIIENAAEAAVRREVFDAVLSDGAGAGEFFQAFRQATFGAEEKRLLPVLEKFVGKYHQLLIACPDRSGWASPSAIWPEMPWWFAEDLSAGKVAERLRELLPGFTELSKGLAGAVGKIADTLPEFQNGAAGKKFDALTLRILANVDGLKDGTQNVIFYRKDLEIDPAMGVALADAGGFIFRAEFASKLQQTEGIYELMRRFEILYHERVRRSGRLSFNDILILLAGAAPDFDGGGGETKTPQLSMLDDLPDAGQRRLQIDFRLDGQFHHWLIDEFQDTSRRQWEVIRGLIDEVIDDDSGDRSFYYVGDEKQAIYGWRGGDSRLFTEVQNRYRDRPDARRIHEEHLDVSWRSGPVILEAVNRVFGNLDGLAELLGEDHAPMIRDRWTHAWGGKHSPSKLTKNRPGYVKFVTVETGRAGEELLLGEKEARWQVVLETLKSIDPAGNELSVAVLMRRNGPAAELADYIRQDGEIPVMVEGKMPVGTDHPVATSFRSLLKFAAHPGDTAAWEHIAMTPALTGLDADSLWRTQFEKPRRVLETLHDRGFGAVFRQWVADLRSGHGSDFDPFTERRIVQIGEACRRFDEDGSRSIEEFLAFLDSYSAADAPSSGVVQIMTIHMAKGLDFDAVILADLKQDAITALRDLDAVKGYDDRRRLRWVLTQPRKDLALCVEPLRSAYLEAEMDTALEELCALYVAMTRAKYANYLVLPKLAKGEKSTAPRNLLARQFENAGCEPFESFVGEVPVTVRYEAGDPDWVAGRRDEKDSEVPAEAVSRPADDRSPVTARRRFPLRRRRIPSDAADRRSWDGAARLFLPGSASAGGLGSAVHGLFEQIEWLDDLSEAEREDRWRAQLLRCPEFADEATRQAAKSLADEEIRSRFLRETWRDPIVWIEKRFEMITGEGEWISGVFDRVILERDDSGAFTGARVVDFKTNQVETEEEIAAAVEHYRPQMTAYRKAMARLTGLEEKSIGCELIFTRPREIRTVEFG